MTGVNYPLNVSERQRQTLGWVLLGALGIAVGLVVGGTFGVLLASLGGWTALIACLYLAFGLIRGKR